MPIFSSWDSGIIAGLQIAAAALAVLWLPGAALSVWLSPKQIHPAEWLAGALGLSLSLAALAALLTYYTGIHITPVGLVIILILSGLVAVTGWGVRRLHLRPRWEWLALAGLGAAIIVWRLYQARALALPAWVDSLHHALIIQAILQAGRLPADLAPVVQAPLYYHFGFHSSAALFTALSGLPVEQALLVFGQVLNACTGLAVYRLASVIWQDHRRGLLAAVLVSFVAHMPAYYLTWGRYTLLAGMILLALSLAEIVEGLRRPPSWQAGLRLGLLTIGVLLTHYLAALLLALFFIIIGIGLVISQWRQRAIDWRRWVITAGPPLVAALVCAAWLWRVWQFSSGSISLDVTLPTQLGGEGISTTYASYLWNLSGPHRNHWLLGLAAVGLIFSLLRKHPIRPAGQRALLIWSALLVFGAMPAGFNLYPFRPHHLVMVLFLPAVMWAADVLCAGGEALQRLKAPHWLPGAVVSIATALLVVWGLKETDNILNSATILANRADRRALTWIKNNTPEQSAFFINVTYWQVGIYRGVDGGWWLPIISQRRALLPPAAYSWGATEVVAEITRQAKLASEITTCTPEFYQLLDEAKLDFIYIRQGSGTLQASGLVNCPFIHPIYEQDGVTIYRVSP